MIKNNQTDLPPHYRWNYIALLTDAVCFWTALSFFDPNSVLPAFVRQFTDSSLVIGLIGTVYDGFWLLPQVVIAYQITGKSRKKPYLMGGMWGRLVFVGLALALWAGLGEHPVAILVFFFILLGLFSLSDSITSVAWFDILAKAIPMKQRGRLLGTAQLISGLAGLGAGATIASILGNPNLPFPKNYVLIFSLAVIVLIPSTIALASIREPLESKIDREIDPKPKINDWLAPLREDALFRRWTVARLLVGMISLSTPFYVGHAVDKLHLPMSVVGGFVAAQTLGKGAGGIIFGAVNDRWGPRIVMWAGGFFSVAGPLFACITQLVGNYSFSKFYPFVYVALGFVYSSWMLGFSNYLLEIAPKNQRPLYIGLSNSIRGMQILAPILGGWLLETTSYTLLFGTTAVVVAGGMLLTFTLKEVEEVESVNDFV